MGRLSQNLQWRVRPPPIQESKKNEYGNKGG